LKSERATGAQKLSDEVLALLSVWSDIAGCLHIVLPMPQLPQNPIIISRLIKIRNDFTFLVSAYRGCPGKRGR